MKSTGSRGVTLSLLCLLCSWHRPALAQAEAQASARALFEEGRALLKAGEVDKACTKLEAARRLYTSAGILLNLADCLERRGQTASAWTLFGEAASVASRTDRKDEAAEAKRRQAALDPKLSRLAIRVADAVPGLRVTRDSAPFDLAALETSLPVDPGEHTVRAEAEGHAPFETTVKVTEPGATVTVQVPELEAGPTTPPAAAAAARGVEPAAPPATGERSGGGAQRIIGLSAAGAGVVAIGVGTWLAFDAKSDFDGARSARGEARHTRSVDAVSQANTATWVVVIGTAAAAAGGALWLTAPSGAAGTQVGLQGTTLVAKGTF